MTTTTRWDFFGSCQRPRRAPAFCGSASQWYFSLFFLTGHSGMFYVENIPIQKIKRCSGDYQDFAGDLWLDNFPLWPRRIDSEWGKWANQQMGCGIWHLKRREEEKKQWFGRPLLLRYNTWHKLPLLMSRPHAWNSLSSLRFISFARERLHKTIVCVCAVASQIPVWPFNGLA